MNAESGITESSTGLLPANWVGDAFSRVGDAFGKRRPVGRCGGGIFTAETTGCGWVG